MGGTSWVTLATNDSYSLGALVLAFSLKKVATNHQLSVLVTPGVSDAMRTKLQSVFDVVHLVDPLDSKDSANLLLLKRPELGVTFTKLHCWTLTQFEKCVFLDADTLVLQNCDELFDREEFSAAPDVGWPDCFNSGVFVYRPSNDTFSSLIKFAEEKGSFDGGDQGLLNLYFSGWAHTDISKHLPFIYNMCSTACYSYLPAFKQFGEGVKIIHFIGTAKPWLQQFDTETQTVYPSSEYSHLQPILQAWWNLFCTYIHPELSPEMTHSQWMYTESRHNIYVSHSFNPLTPDNQYVPYFEPNPSREFEDIHNANFYTNPNVEYVKEFYDPWEDQPESPRQSPVREFFESPELISNFPQESQTHSDNYISPEISHSNQCQESVNLELINDYFDNREIDSNANVSLEVDFIDSNSNPVTLEPVSECFSVSEDVRNSENSYKSGSESEPSLNSVNVQTQITTVSDNNENMETSTTAGLAGAFAQMTLGAPRSSAQSALEDHFRRQSWEIGNIDYMGRDSFANIWQKISSTISTPVEEETAQSGPAPQLESSAQKSSAAAKTSKMPASRDAKVSSPEKEERSDSKPLTSEAVSPNAQTIPPETPPTPKGSSPPKSKAAKAKPDNVPPPKAASPPKSQQSSKQTSKPQESKSKKSPPKDDKPTKSQPTEPVMPTEAQPSPNIESCPLASAPQKSKQQSPPKKGPKEQPKPTKHLETEKPSTPKSQPEPPAKAAENPNLGSCPVVSPPQKPKQQSPPKKSEQPIAKPTEAPQNPNVESCPLAPTPQKPKQPSPPKKAPKEQPKSHKPESKPIESEAPSSQKASQKKQSDQKAPTPPPVQPNLAKVSGEAEPKAPPSDGTPSKKNKKAQKDPEPPASPPAPPAPLPATPACPKQATPSESATKPAPASKKHKKGHKEPPNVAAEPTTQTVEDIAPVLSEPPQTPSKKNKRPQDPDQVPVPTTQCQKPAPAQPEKPVEVAPKSITPQEESCPQPPPRKDKKGGGAKKGNK